MADRCPLLRLPGEIRNLIYAYVLSEETRLQYICCTICNRGSILAPVKDLDPPHYNSTAVSKTKKAHDLEKGKQLVPPLVNTSKHVHGQDDANQLKFVNRQLHQETRGLVIRYNDLKFRNIVHFAKFLDSCPRFYHAYLRVLEVNQCMLQLDRALSLLSISHR